MTSKSDKPLIAILIAACSIVILIFHFAWAHYLFMNYSTRPFFTILDIAVILAYSWASLKAYNNADDPNKDWLRWAVVALTIASCVWAAAWSTGLMNNLDQGI